MMLPHDTAIVGAFFMEGMRDAVDYQTLLAKWEQGCYELVYEVTRYAPFCWELAEAGVKVTGNFPGVYDYEVSAPFGTWFAERIMNGEEPTPDQCRIWLLNAVEQFFMQGEEEDVSDKLAKALFEVEFKV